MMDKEKALNGFGTGINCAMAVFGELAPELGLPEEQARKIASAFGSGMGRGNTCGCVSGALMALGLAFGADGAGQSEKAQQLSEKKSEFEKLFIEKFGSLTCCEMLGGLNPSVPEQLADIVEKGLMPQICAPAVCFACETVMELIDD
ncbi:MAG: C_GCAxxG_C_C family protein [Oscillospiraceae bacterium]|nr:C_GCAxxG_C_C family protein [Oscillospiraceae bacterium]